MIEVTDEMVTALFETANGGEFASDADVREGLAAVLAIVARDHCLERRGHVWHPLAKAAPRPWCGAPSGLGGQQPCPVKKPCGPGQCAIGSAVGNETYRAGEPS